jgi:hypothetical protein
MNTIQVEAAKVINAPVEDIYAVIADYDGGHRAILPKPYFTDMIIEKGGHGAGTRLRVYMEIWGQRYTFHQEVTEPEPGRMLKETDIETGQYTTFTFEPLSDTQTRVIIRSVFPAKGGFAGFMEKLMQPPITRSIYHKELNNLESFLSRKQGSA